MRDETIIDEQEAEEMHEAMDYAQHEGTWEAFTGVVKWGIYEIGLIVLALYSFIQAGAWPVGALLLLIALVSPFGYALFGPRR